MRTLILGAKGQLGRDLMEVFAARGAVKGCDLPQLDIADEVALQPVVEQFAPTIIINAAAYTDVEGAEDNLQDAFLANETGARNVAELSAYHQIPVVYFSTDYVFDGTKNAPYVPSDPVAPLGVYGESKAAGEAATRITNARHFIIRTAWLYGPGGNNFVEKIIQAAETRPKLRVVDDEIGSPTHTRDLAEATLALTQTEAYGTYHAVNAGDCTRYNFAKEILRLTGIGSTLDSCASSEFPTKAPRPRYSVLDASSLTEACGYEMRPWQEALLNYMDRRKVLV
ncbi:MAG: dTDP-4-dehydrorhamnose reductase [Candidatus Hydrogenedentes bacterium]|nr:dTDP-4-dehydrorhamnose reductase [Candidatus Hydrogenedentota bacterium]